MLFTTKEDGQSLVEYSFVLVSVAILLIALLAIVGTITGGMYQDIIDALSAVFG